MKNINNKEKEPFSKKEPNNCDFTCEFCLTENCGKRRACIGITHSPTWKYWMSNRNNKTG